MTRQPESFHGGCSCRQVRYDLSRRPLIVHCCHCTWCQRETGTAFALNAVVEAEAVKLTNGDVEIVDTPSQSGNGQKIARCPRCRVALWSNYHQAGPAVRFLRVGTLDTPGEFPPDVHIHASSKLPWVVIPADARVFAEFYDAKREWPAEVQERFKAARAKYTASNDEQPDPRHVLEP